MSTALERLKEARKKGGRLSQWKPTVETDIFDHVTEDQYKAIVGDRLDQDDFIEDDGTGDYVDDGREDWDGAESQEESEDEDAFDGEDEEYRKARQLKKAKAKAKAAANPDKAPKAKPKPKASYSDYARPSNKSSTSYRAAAPSALAEDDFMASLLSGIDAPSSTRKRKSSPEIPSSDGFPEPSSDSSFFSSSRKRYGAESDDETMWDAKRGIMGKKPRVSDVTVTGRRDSHMDVDQENDIQWDDDSMDIDEIKAERADSDDDDIRVKSKPLTTSKVNGVTTKRKVVNASSVKHVLKREPSPVASPAAVKAERAEVEMEVDPKVIKPRLAAKPKGKSKHWSAIQADLAAKAAEADVDDLEAAKAPVNSTIHSDDVLEADGSLKFFWLDHYEEAGHIHLIGKVLDQKSGKYVSCCVSVLEMERCLYVKPRAKKFADGHQTDLDVSQDDVLDEFDSFRRKSNISETRVRWVRRQYAFEDQTVEREESDWLEVRYPFHQPEIPAGSSGSTFSHIFGTNTTPFELFAVQQKIMGPSWLEIKDLSPAANAATWCKIEFCVESPSTINPFPETDNAAPKDTPPLTAMSISIRTIVNLRENKTEVLAISLRTWDDYNIEDPTPPDQLRSQITTVIRPIEKFPAGFEAFAKNPKDGNSFHTVKNERSLLNLVLTHIQRHDPDVLVGHNFLGTNFETMLYRFRELSVDKWSRIGRFRRGKGIKISKMGSNVRLLSGRLVADLSSDAAKGMISSTTWSLTEMCLTHLKIQREDIDPEDTATYFDHSAVSPDKLITFTRLCEVDAFFQMAIAARVQILPLTKQLTNLAGNSWNLTLNGGRAVRNEFILLHEFNRLGYVCPDKAPFKAKTKVSADGDEGNEDLGAMKAGKGKAKYSGGLVFEPKRGLWDKYILVMDFNSLYPSIIQEFNIDFTTVVRGQDGDDEDKIPEVPRSGEAKGVLPKIISTLVNRRKQVKGLMKNKSATPAQILQWDIKQLALKLTANSMYGCLGFVGSRFSSRPLAALTTFKGREILGQTRQTAENDLGLDVVYGDTDSVFVNSNVTTYPEAFKIANDFKKAINDKYRLLEIDLDAVFERILLLNKKKYAAVKIDESGERITEVKGLDMKRREYSQLSKDCSTAVLKEILSGESTEVVVQNVHDYLIQVGEAVRNNEVPLEDFIIFKRLGKNPEEYPEKNALPHVQVALRMKAKGTSAKAHDVIPYIMCLDEDGKSGKTQSGDRAFHPDDLRRQGSELRIDYEYYLDNQILVPVNRLCETIEGTERARMAECLGLDPRRYANTASAEAQEQEFATFDSQISDEDRYRDVDPLKLTCPGCMEELAFVGLLGKEEAESHIRANGICCDKCNTPIHPASLGLQLENQIRAHIAQYYLGWMVCDGEGCGSRTRTMGVYGKRCLGFAREDCRGTMRLEYTDMKLYHQLLYYRSLFDVDKILAPLQGSKRLEEVRPVTLANKKLLSDLVNVTDKYLSKNGRRYVDLGGLFKFMEKIKL
ncbi:hypothetical protein L202_06353 [Cryptococcus amylolentus CBS 6039]|uniref:DNA polymerase n=1 Tax=Cryptococcus amylolentus CBS 6039 TaxID=1295533 RepID=A0A1E3HFL8_9TREE|nr:hypothetical protein L202_06353 [Cryptococcus amylolentus CBS 6039]ODN75148.1 hypothetical protein L202_06353 [Cryptococcus amylolentus CBS 6039]